MQDIKLRKTLRKRVDYNEIYDLIEQGYRVTDIGRYYGITRNHVYRIRDIVDKRTGFVREKKLVGFALTKAKAQGNADE